MERSTGPQVLNQVYLDKPKTGISPQRESMSITILLRVEGRKRKDTVMAAT